MSIRRHTHAPATPSFPEALAADVRTQACLEDSEVALHALQEEQRLIADELEDTFVAYDRKLRAAAKRLASVGPDALNADEHARLQAEQLELWRLLRRAQAAQRSTRELLRESREWRTHDVTIAPEGHPDHPDTRVEIVESELRVRGVRVTDGQEASSAVQEDVPGIHWLHRPAFHENGTEDEPVIAVSVSGESPAWEHGTDDVLLQEIYQYERELARTTAPSDIRDLLAGLRALHGHLRQHDRRTGRARIRWHMGFGQAH